MTAQQKAQARLESIYKSLAAIERELEHYSDDDDITFDYSDVGDLAEVDDKLREVWEFLAEVD